MSDFSGLESLDLLFLSGCLSTYDLSGFSAHTSIRSLGCTEVCARKIPIKNERSNVAVTPEGSRPIILKALES